MSESVAHDQLRAFIERVERPADRLAYVMSRMEHCRGIDDPSLSRAIRLAGEVLGVEYATARRITHDAMFDAARVDWIGPLRPSVIGFVYLARLDGRPNLVKIGFSQDPPRRERELSSGLGGVTIFRTFIGTMLDEHAAHCDRRSLRMSGEWFRAREAA